MTALGSNQNHAMAEAQDSTTLSGDDLIAELIRNMEAGTFKMRQTVLVPCIYHIYLHPRNFEQLRPIVRHVEAEMKAALDEHLEQLNRGKLPGPLAKVMGGASGPEFKRLERTWTVELHPDDEGSLQAGEIEIHSELGSGEQEEFGEGAKTTLITKRESDGSATSRLEAGHTAAASQAWGRLRWTDANGAPREFVLAKEHIVIGRAGRSFWADVQLEAPNDVSREHCRLRRDPATGTVLLKDVSAFGTSVDGQRVPSSMVERNGERVDGNIETPLPPRARIGLAEVLFLDYEAVTP